MKTNQTFADGHTSAILDNLNTAVFRTDLEDADGIIDVNPAFMDMFGYTDKQELASISLRSLHADPEDHTHMREELLKLGSISDREIRLKRKDGSIFLGRINSVLVKGESGKPLFIDGMVDDISASHSKEKALLIEREVFFSGPVVMIQWPVDENAALINISENVRELLGFESADFLEGRVLYPDLVHPEDKADLQKHIRAILSQSTMVMLVHPYRLKRKKGDYIWVQDYAYIQRDEAGQPERILGYIYDVTAQQNSQKKLYESERRLRDLVENSPTGILRTDSSGKILEVNQRIVDILGSPTKEEILSINVFTFKSLIDAGISEQFKNSIKHNKTVTYEGRYRSDWGRTLYLKLIISPVHNADGELSGVQANMEDMTSAHLANAEKESIKKAQLEERKIFMAGPIMIVKWAYSADDPALYVSENVEKILGYTREEFLSPENVPSKVIHADDLQRVRQSASGALERHENAFHTNPYRLQRKDGSYIWVSDFTTINWDSEGHPSGFSGLIWDVSKMVEAEQELELMLREVHHRAKNNMQVIISLLNIQSEYLGDDRLFKIFGETQSRIRTMALIHDKLFRSTRLSSVDFGNYVKSLIYELHHFLDIDTNRIHIHQDLGEFGLDISKAIPCGLIVNELMTNALKYAFPENREGSVWVTGRVESDKTAVIEIKDDGIGLSEDLNFQDTQTMGLRIVRILTEQLDGQVVISRSNGTCCRLTFSMIDAG